MTYGFTATVNPLQITGSITGFQWVLTAANFPLASVDGGATSIDNGGGNLRCYTDSSKSTQLPIDVLVFVTGGSPECLVWGRSPSLGAGDTVYVEADEVATVQPLPSSTYGSEAVYADNVVAFTGQALVDSSGNTVPTGNATQGVAGILGDSFDFAAGNRRIDFVLPSSPVNKYTLTGWAMPPAGAGEACIFSIADKDVPDDQDRLSQQNSNTIRATNFSGSGVQIEGVSSAAGTWRKYTLSIDQTQTPNAKLYIDGALAGDSTAGGDITAFDRVTLGVTADSTPIWFYDGKINTTIATFSGTTDEKEEAEYNNQSDPGAFWSASAWEEQGAPTEPYPWWLFQEED